MKRVDIPPATVTIEFTREELEALARVCGRVGGDLKTTRRKHTNALAELIAGLGITYDIYDEAVDGSLNFRK